MVLDVLSMYRHFSVQKFYWICEKIDDCLSITEPTLTIVNLKVALDEVELRHIGDILKVPQSRSEQTKQAIIEDFIFNHPAPSWRLIADCLYQIDTGGTSTYEFGRYHGTLQNLKRKYLKGKKMM